MFVEYVGVVGGFCYVSFFFIGVGDNKVLWLGVGVRWVVL